MKGDLDHLAHLNTMFSTDRVCSSSDECIKTIYKAIGLIKSSREAKKWTKYINRSIRIVKKSLLNQWDGENCRKLEANLAHLKYQRVLLRKIINKKVKNNYVLWQDVESCFQGRIKSGMIVNIKLKDYLTFFNKAFKSVNIKIRNALKNSLIKANTILYAKFILPKTNEISTKTFSTKNTVIDTNTSIREWYKELTDEIITKLSEFQARDSGWSLIEVLFLKVNINQYTPLTSGSYIPLPKFIQKKKAVVNVKNNDKYCFLWAILSALYPAKTNVSSIYSYPHVGVLNTEDIEFPIQLKSIPKFERINNLTINVYLLEKGTRRKYEISPVYLSKCENLRVVNLLMFRSYNSVDYYHFAWIKNLSRLISSQTSKHSGRRYICNRCLNFFYCALDLEKHGYNCENNTCAIEMPTKSNNIIRFKNFRNSEKCPFVIYADFEGILQKWSEKVGESTLYQKHIPMSVAYYLKCDYNDEISKFKIFRGKECLKWFINELKDVGQKIDQILKFDVVQMIPLDENTEKLFQAADRCWICENTFSKTDIKVRDHCHLTGKYRGPAHQSCNLNFKTSHVVPVVFHNLSGYDAHLIIKDLVHGFEGKIKLLPINKEKYISFSKRLEGTSIDFRFIDSFKFLATSLDTLASNLEDQFKVNSQKYFPEPKSFSLIRQKGIYPYDYIDSWEKLEENQLPSIEHFYNKLNDKHITENQYAHAVDVWNHFNCKTLGQYSDIYLKTDVLLLADVFENFRNNCIRIYNLDALHYYTAPGFAFDAMLKYTKIELELLTDIDMLLFIESGIRGGIAQCSNRYSKANNKFLKSGFDPSIEEKYITYFDVVNMYGWAMSRSLPYGGFEWVDVSKGCNIDINSLKENDETGYIFEVDLKYPKHLFDIHKDLPLCPEHIVAPNATSNSKKLMATLYNKTKYVLHYLNLQQCIRQGLELERVHRVLSFKQRPWLKPYIDLNTRLRQSATNEFDKSNYKLWNNAVYGKTIENVRKYKDIRIVSTWDGQWGAKILISKPNFKSCTIFDENFVIVEQSRTKITFNKPIYVGMCILDISKVCLYEFHYDFMKKTMGNNAKLLYTDTDSLIYEISNINIYDIIKNNVQRFDTSDYGENNQFGIPLANKKKLGLMKDENNGKIVTEFVGLRAKMYSYKIQNTNHEVKKAKGVTSSALTKLSFADYYNCLFNKQIFRGEQNLIRSRKHDIYSLQQKKVFLCPHDDKRSLNYMSTDTLPWGYSSAP